MQETLSFLNQIFSNFPENLNATIVQGDKIIKQNLSK